MPAPLRPARGRLRHRLDGGGRPRRGDAAPSAAATERLERRALLAAASFDAGTLTLDFEQTGAAAEDVTAANDGETISLTGDVTGDAAVAAGAVDRIVVIDSGGGTAQSLTFVGDTAYSLSGGLSADGVETVRVREAVTAAAGDIAITAPRSIDVLGRGALSSTGGAVTLDAGGVAGDYVAVVLGGDVTAGGGDLTVTGRGGDVGQSNLGVQVLGGATVSAANGGSVLVDGTGGAAAGDFNYGVLVTGENTAITSAGGAVTVTGTGGGTGFSASNYGVFLASGGTVTAGGTGAVTVDGTGGVADGFRNYGVLVVGPGTAVRSGGGDVTVLGRGGGTDDSSIAYGVFVDQAAVVTAGGLGNVAVDGRGGDNFRDANHGVRVVGSGSEVTSAGGDVAVTGRGGRSGGVGRSSGVVLTGGAISAAGDGSVTVNGTGDAVGGDFINGVALSGNGAGITSSGGDVLVAGRGGGNSVGSFDYGVSVGSGATVSAGGAGTVTVDGVAGGLGGRGHHGVYVFGAASSITSAGGAVTVTGRGGGVDSADDNHGVHLIGGSLSAGGTAETTVEGTGGAGDSDGVRVLDGATVGHAGGDLTVTAVASDLSTDLFDETTQLLGQTVTLRAVGETADVGAAGASVEVDAERLVGRTEGGGFFVRHTGGPLALGEIDVLGEVVIDAAGAVDVRAGLTGDCVLVTAPGPITVDPAATLNLLQNEFPAEPGDTLTVLDTTGPVPVAGEFANVPDGNRVSFNGITFTADYAGNEGSDLVLTATGDDGPTADAGGPYAITEGDALTLDGSASTDPDEEPLTFHWDVDGDGDFDEDVTGATPTVTAARLAELGIGDGPDGPREITLEVSNGFETDTRTTTLRVANAAPADIVFDGPADALPREELAFTGTFTDPGAADTHTATVDWGDGTVEALDVTAAAGGGTLAGRHTYAEAGRYAVAVTVADDDGGRTRVSRTYTVSPIGVRADPLRGGTTFFAFGTAGRDRLRVYRLGGGFGATINAARFGPTGPADRVVIFAGGGADVVTASRTRGGGLGGATELHGEGGNDLLRGGAAGDLLVGGSGNDRLIGGGGTDLLVGGDGTDLLLGDAGEDLLIAGTLNLDSRGEPNRERARFLVARSWQNGRSPVNRTRALADLLDVGDTVLDDGRRDVLRAADNYDWYFAETTVNDELFDTGGRVVLNDEPDGPA